MTRWRRPRLGAALLAALAAATSVTTVATVSPASAQDVPPTITFVRQTAEVDPDGRFTVIFDVDHAPAGGSYVVDIDDRVVTRDDLDAPATGLGGWRATFDPVPLPGSGPRHRIEVTLHLYDRGQARPPDAGPWAYQLTEPGVYPVRLRIRDADDSDLTAAVTYLIRRPSTDVEAPTARVALLVPLAPASPEDEVLDAATIRPILDVLGQHPDIPITLAIDPDLLEATAARPDDELITDLTALIERDDVELLGAPFTDIDAASLTATGLGDTITEMALLGDDALTDVVGQAGTPTWWQPRPLDPGSAFAIATAGVNQLVVPPSAVLGDAPLLPTPLVGLDPSFTVVSTATDLASGPVADPVLAARRWLGHVGAEATLAGGRGSATATLVDPSTVDVEVLDQVLALLATELATVRPVTISDLFDVDAAITPIALTTPRVDDLTSYLTAREQFLSTAASYATMRADPAVADDAQARALARSARAGLTIQQRLEMLDEIERSLEQTYAAITTGSDDRITLGARNATIPLPVESSATEPLRVRVRLSSSNRLELPHDDFEVMIDPGRTTVSIPVRVRTSGDIPMQVQITTPDGAIVLDESRYTIRSTAVSGVGIILTVGAAGFLALWWGRHIWRSRRPRDDGQRDDGQRDVTASADLGSNSA